jgi:nicotinamide mononucleotide transporter
MSLLEFAAVIASAFGVWLTTQRRLSSWPVILLACLLYALVFHREKLYSDMLLQFVFGAFAVYGWWHWQRGIKEEGSVRVERLSWQGLAAGIIVGIAGSAVLGTLMAHYTDAALPHIDAALTGFSLVAQFWSTRKHLANWWLWIVVDVIYTGVFVYKDLYLTAALYAFFVSLAVVGLRAWRKALREQKDPLAKPIFASASDAVSPEPLP